MNSENDSFMDYYNEPSGKPAGETGMEILAALEKKAEEEEKRRAEDFERMSTPMNIFLKRMNALIGALFREEQARGTRLDLIVTLAMGGMAFTAANVFYLITKTLKVEITLEEYQERFLHLFHTAVKTIGKNEH